VTDVQTFRGAVRPGELGWTLIHEHVFVRDPPLERDLGEREWQETDALDRAVRGLEALFALGIRTIVDLTVPGLGRDVGLVSRVAARAPVHVLAATGYYTPAALPVFFRFHGPGRLIDRVDPLIEMFVRDIEVGIAGTGVRAAMLKVVTGEEGFTEDVSRVMAAAAEAQRRTGVPITTHSHPQSRNGLDQLAFLGGLGVPADRVIVGHSGDSEDVDYLRALMDRGATIGMDRFGMEHVLADDRRVGIVVALVRLGYADRMVLSHDAAFYSHVTPPSWRARSVPAWHMETLPRRILPWLREAGVGDDDIHQMLVLNPARLLAPTRAAGLEIGVAAEAGASG
jgi:phosphotriesterase-related protein